eukprot:gnl/TRDRNA2_/TRDRNA2_86042_c0_seq1.p1 gnl/TRDRNA2_/TRDRNA2_86042_c0~~gnl/TRDRNA2_/TRDRNA2_86042_c0_seq1.p1  ORF type:complete len:820 (+),score=101.18 gnl/TRDRNA2_/TRDRNA2_86042_c0_seq1:96-2462(+)
MGLDGVGKVVAAIFQEVLEDDAVAPEVSEREESRWQSACRRRFLRALGGTDASGGPGAAAVASAPTYGKRKRTPDEARQPVTAVQTVCARRRLPKWRSGALSSCATLPGAAQQPQPLAGGSHQQLGPALPRAGTSPIVSASHAAAAQPAAAAAPPKSRAPVASRLSLAAKCRRSVAPRRGNVPVSGSAAWCMLVALGLYSDDASHHALLTREDIERCVDMLRPYLPRCDQFTQSAVSRLLSRGLVEEFGNRYRLTTQGRSMADGLVRKLEVPLTALESLRVHATCSQAPVASTPACARRDCEAPAPSGSSMPGARDAAVASSARKGDASSDDDAPLSNLATLAVRRRLAAQFSTAASPPRRQQVTSRPEVEHVRDAADASGPAEERTVDGCELASKLLGLLGKGVASSSSAASCAQDGSSREPSGQDTARAQGRRPLHPAMSDPAPPARTSLSPERAMPQRKRRLAPTQSAPPLPVPGSLRNLEKDRSPHRWLSGQRSRLVLLLDHREVGAGREHSARGALLADLMSRLGADAVEGRSLPLGDVLWIWRTEAAEAADEAAMQEFVAGWAVERKTFHDLGASIVDGRYDEQKARLLEAPGLHGVIYLVEGQGPLFGVGESTSAGGHGSPGNRGFGQRLLSRGLPPATLSTSVAHTQLITGFHVAHTTSTMHTVAYLVALHGALRATACDLVAGDRSDKLVSYREFAERTRKSCHSRAFEVFGRMLRVVPHCGPEATEALVDEFSSVQSFAAALRDSSDMELLQRLKARRGGRAPVNAATLAACRELFVS